jgi:TolB-like protein
VLVVPFANLTGQPQNDVVADTSTDTIELTLRLLDQYEVVGDTARTSDPLMDAPVSELRRIAGEENVDNVIFGSVSTLEGGGFLFQLSVYDRAQDGISLQSESRSPSLFGVFDASDELVADAVSGFSGVRIGFGSLRIASEGSGEFLLYVDGSLLGENTTSVDRILIGNRQIEIRQVRGDQETPIYREAVTIRENQTTTVAFSFPDVTDDELAREAQLRSRLMEALAIGADLRAIDQSMSELSALYARLPGALEGSEDDLVFYRDRRDLAAAMQEIPLIDLESIARLPGGAPRTAGTELIDPWEAVWDRYVEAEEGGVGFASSYDYDQQRQAIRGDIRRNLDVLHGQIAMERALVIAQEDYELLDGYNALRQGALPLNRAPLRSYTWSSEAGRASDAYREYQRAVERRRPFWHWIAGTIGVGGLGYAAYGTFVADTGELERKIEDNIVRYENATDLDEINALRSQIDSDIDRLNLMETIPTYAAAGGGVFLSSALFGRVVSRTRPNRVWRRYRDDPFLERWTAAGLDMRSAREDANGTYVVVVGPDETFRVDDNEEVFVTPHVFEAAPGESWSFEHMSARPTELDIYQLSTEQGITVVTLGVEP